MRIEPKPSSRAQRSGGPGPRSGVRGPWVPALRFAAAGMTGMVLAGSAAAQQAPLLREPLGLDPNYTTVMLTVDLPPNGKQPATTAGTPGHRHPGSTYAYVTKGEVVNRLGDASEKRFKAGQAWSEVPGQAHYIVNTSATEPAQLVVVMVIPKAAAAITEPLAK